MGRFFLILCILLGISQANDSDLDYFEKEFKGEYITQERRFDPLEGYNEVMTDFNDFAYENAIDPLARGYKYVVGRQIRIFIANFFDNLLSPIRFVNNLLQGKIQNSGEELFRFALNSTLGFAGIADPAKILYNVDKHPEDFGQTLGFYGAKSGFPIVLPFLGPSNLRDTIGLVGDSFAHPVSYVEPTSDSIAIKAYGNVNDISLHVDDYYSIKKDAIELYPYLQDLYEKRREYLIKK